MDSTPNLFSNSGFLFSMLPYYGRYDDWRALMTLLCKQTHQFWVKNPKMIENLEKKWFKDTRTICKVLNSVGIPTIFDEDRNLKIDLKTKISNSGLKLAIEATCRKSFQRIKNITLNFYTRYYKTMELLLHIFKENIENFEGIISNKETPWTYSYPGKMKTCFELHKFIVRKSKYLDLQRVKFCRSSSFYPSFFLKTLSVNTLEYKECYLNISPFRFSKFIEQVSEDDSNKLKNLVITDCVLNECCASCIIDCYQKLRDISGRPSSGACIIIESLRSEISSAVISIKMPNSV